MTGIKLHPVTNASNGQTIYINPAAVRLAMPSGHRTALVFSENHVVLTTADLRSLIDSGVFEVVIQDQ